MCRGNTGHTMYIITRENGNQKAKFTFLKIVLAQFLLKTGKDSGRVP